MGSDIGDMGRVDERVDRRHFVSHPRLGAAFLSSAIFMAEAPTVIISSTTFASPSGLKSAVQYDDRRVVGLFDRLRRAVVVLELWTFC
jgi:hypothetical protein